MQSYTVVQRAQLCRGEDHSRRIRTDRGQVDGVQQMERDVLRARSLDCNPVSGERAFRHREKRGDRSRDHGSTDTALTKPDREHQEKSFAAIDAAIVSIDRATEE